MSDSSIGSYNSHGYLSGYDTDDESVPSMVSRDHTPESKDITDDQATLVKNSLCAASGAGPTRYYEAILDNGSQVSVFHPRFLRNIRPGKGSYKVLSGNKTETQMEGSLPGFFNCMASDEAQVNVLSQADVEDIYECVYTPGESYVIKMGEDELVFERRDKLYIADMSDWIKDSYQENDNSLSFLTVAEKEHMYTRKERRKALLKEFV